MKQLVLIAASVLLLSQVHPVSANSEHKTHDHPDHQHKADCGHKAETHGDHTDYEHDGHHHKGHDQHWDECNKGPHSTTDTPSTDSKTTETTKSN